MAKTLEEFGYNVTRNADSRHRALGKAINAFGYGKVYDRLKARERRTSGYKEKRFRADANFVSDRADRRGRTLF